MGRASQNSSGCWVGRRQLIWYAITTWFFGGLRGESKQVAALWSFQVGAEIARDVMRTGRNGADLDAKFARGFLYHDQKNY